MSQDITGFELIALDRLIEACRMLPFDPRTMESLEQKGLIVQHAGEWTITSRGRSTVAQVMCG